MYGCCSYPYFAVMEDSESETDQESSCLNLLINHSVDIPAGAFDKYERQKRKEQTGIMETPFLWY